jgi:UDP:flavonoid glycosyltransferase YjiC (YdhE family)
MARIVLTSWGSHGDIDPFLALGRELMARGHAVTLATAASYRGAAESAGLAFRPVRPDVDLDDALWARRAMDARRGTEVVFREVLLSAVEASFADLMEAVRGADLMVSHPAAFAAPVVAAYTGVPWLSTVLAPMSLFSAHDAPVLAAAPWAKAAERRLGPWVGRMVIAGVRAGVRGWSEPVFRLRARLGLPRGGEPVLEGQHSPRGVLALFSRVLALPQPDWPPLTRITGPLFYDAPHGRRLDARLAAFLDDGEPPIVFTMGSSGNQVAGDVYANGADAARRLGRRAVLLVGRGRVAEFEMLLPRDAIAVAAAPHSLLFPRAAAVVQHCGVGTLTQALHAGVPVLALPFAHDQADNAYRAARLGVARTLAPRRAGAGGLAQALRPLLEDPSYARRAAEVAAVVRSEDGAGAACEAIEAALERSGAAPAAGAPASHGVAE